MFGLPLERRLVTDMITLGRSIPHHHLERAFQLAELGRLRAASQPRISWSALFIKAYALVAQQTPVLRRAYVRWPWPRLYEHPRSTVSIAVQRENPDCLFWPRLNDPAGKSLVKLQEKLDKYKNGPMERVFRSQLRFARVPGPLRWLLWRMAFSFSGRRRAREFGTFGLSTLAGHGFYNRTYPSILATNLTLGPIDERGCGLVGLMYDHRIMDGIAAIRALADMEKALHGPVTAELHSLVSANAAA